MTDHIVNNQFKGQNELSLLITGFQCKIFKFPYLYDGYQHTSYDQSLFWERELDGIQ